MSAQLPGERGVSPVSGTRRVRFTPRQKAGFVVVLATAAIGFVFWHDSARKRQEPPERARADRIAQLVPYVPPPRDAPPPPQPMTPPPPSPSPMPPPMPSIGPNMAGLPFNRGQEPPKVEHRPRMLAYGGGAPPARAAPAASTAPVEAQVTGVQFKSSQIEGAKAGPAMDLTLTLLPGAFHCTLETAINSTLPGPIDCKLPEDVRSPTGVVLMPAGTHVYGEYKNNIATGENRIFTLAAYAITPDGVPVPLNAPMGDGLGRAGVEGDVDNHTLERFGGAVLLSLAQSGLSVAQSAVSRGGNTNLSFSTGDTSSIAQEILRSTIGIKPTITVNQGEDVTILLRYPISFKDAYRLRVR